MGQFIESLGKVMSADVQGVNAIAQNNSNTNTVGYRSVSPFLSVDLENNQESLLNIVQANVRHNFNVGSINITGNDTDIALASEGWFGVGMEEAIYFTRKGNFSISADGFIVSEQGAKLLDVQMEPIFVGDDSFVVTRDGSVEVGSAIITKIGVFHSERERGVVAVGDGIYQVDGAKPTQEKINLIQGALESANTDTAADMVKLIEISRHIESLQRSISYYDDLLNTGINQIGK